MKKLFQSIKLTQDASNTTNRGIRFFLWPISIVLFTLISFVILIGVWANSENRTFLPFVHIADAPASSLSITDISDNRNDYPGNAIPTYEKFEITFQIDTVADNPLFPYDPSPPGGIAAGLGITANALFTPDNWQTVYTQPAFYYQEFDDNQGTPKGGQDWFYPTGQYSWKVRFAPPQAGAWQYKLTARDTSGQTETGVLLDNLDP